MVEQASDIETRIDAVLAEWNPDAWPNAATGFEAVRLLPDARKAMTGLRAELDAVRSEARACFDAQSEIDATWDAIGTRGNPNALSLSEQVASLMRELDAALNRAEAAERLVKAYQPWLLDRADTK